MAGEADAMGQMAEMVVLAIKTALAPIVARTQALEEELAAVRAAAVPPAVVEQAQAAMRERIEALETMASMPPPELAAVIERLAAVETWTSVPDPALADELKAVSERIDAIEAKAAELPPEPTTVDLTPALAPMQERIAAFDERIAGLDVKVAAVDPVITELRERVVTVETTAAMPPVGDLSEAHLVDLRARVTSLETKVQTETPRDITGLCERMAVLETRAPVPGPAGADGQNGKDGADGRDGKDGADGLGFDDMGLTFDGDRTITFAFERGVQKKAFPIAFPFMKQQGIYHEGQEYVTGDIVTWGGSQWHCNEPTISKPGEGAKAWTLVVKRGRDGKDGRDAPGAPPVVSIGRPR